MSINELAPIQKCAALAVTIATKNALRLAAELAEARTRVLEVVGDKMIHKALEIAIDARGGTSIKVERSGRWAYFTRQPDGVFAWVMIIKGEQAPFLSTDFVAFSYEDCCSLCTVVMDTIYTYNNDSSFLDRP